MPDAISSANQAPLPPVSQQPQQEPQRDRETELRPEQRAQTSQENDRPEPRRPDPEARVGVNIDTTA